MTDSSQRLPITIGGVAVPAGSQERVELPVARLMSGAPIALPLLILHGPVDGPTLWLSGAIHGDELCGVEIIRRVIADLRVEQLVGTIIAAPIVNVYGFNTGDRYLPDRRDLNRSFPGSARGSMASQLARLFMTEVVARSSVGIDLHTGSDHRINLPQIRTDLDDPKAASLAAEFAAPVTLHSRVRDGSLRQAGAESGATVLLYEGGEALRFDEASVQAGVEGVHRVLHSLGMTAEAAIAAAPTRTARHSRWVRAPRSGILHMRAGLGEHVPAGATVADVVGPFGRVIGRMTARSSGMVIGHRQHPLVNKGDAVAHLAEIDRSGSETA